MNLWSAVVISLFSGTAAHAIGALIAWLRSRKGKRASAARDQKVEEAAAKKAEIDRAELLAEAQRISQTTALESANQALAQVRQDCKDCRDDLHGLRDVTGQLVDALEALMANDTRQTRADARATIRMARQTM